MNSTLPRQPELSSASSYSLILASSVIIIKLCQTQTLAPGSRLSSLSLSHALLFHLISLIKCNYLIYSPVKVLITSLMRWAAETLPGVEIVNFNHVLLKHISSVLRYFHYLIVLAGGLG